MVCAMGYHVLILARNTAGRRGIISGCFSEAARWRGVGPRCSRRRRAIGINAVSEVHGGISGCSVCTTQVQSEIDSRSDTHPASALCAERRRATRAARASVSGARTSALLVTTDDTITDIQRALNVIQPAHHGFNSGPHLRPYELCPPASHFTWRHKRWERQGVRCSVLSANRFSKSKKFCWMYPGMETKPNLGPVRLACCGRLLCPRFLSRALRPYTEKGLEDGDG